MDRTRKAPDGPDLELHVGDAARARVVVVLPVVREPGRFQGALAEVAVGPWGDLDEAKQQLQEIADAGAAGKDVRLDWLFTRSEIVAAYLDVENDQGGQRRSR